MKFYRIKGIILRFLYQFRHSFDRLSDVFYWPTIDLLLWGLTSQFFKSIAPGAEKILVTIIMGILFWIVAWRGQYEISVNLLEDLWNENFINIFVSPLRFSEWVISFLIIGLIKAIISLSFASLVAYILYRVHIFGFGFLLLPFLLSLLLMGWWVGFFVAGLILRYGTRVQTFAWTLVMVLSPFSAISFPVSILPTWAQYISRIIPASYVFEGAREILYTGKFNPDYLLFSYILNFIYLILGYIFLWQSFKQVLKRGMVHLY